MIISSYDDIPYFTCKSAEIRPKSKTEYSGRFEVEGKTFTINILDERNEKESVSRVWARIGLIKLPEICANICFGGTRRNQLFMCASQSLYVLPVETRGAHFC